MDASRCISIMDLNDPGRPDTIDYKYKDMSMRILWALPFVHKDTEQEIGSVDTRGLLTSLKSATIRFENLSAYPLTLKCNTPKSSPLAANKRAVVSRDNDCEISIPGSGSGRVSSKLVHVEWKDPTELITPCFTPVQLSVSGNYEEMISLLDFAVVKPDINESDGRMFVSKQEMVKVSVSVSYTSNNSFPPGVSVISRSEVFYVVKRDLLDMYTVNAILRDVNEPGFYAAKAPQWLPIDNFEDYSNVGFRWTDSAGHPLERTDVDAYDLRVQLVGKNRNSTKDHEPIRLRAYEGGGFIVQTLFGPLVGLGGYELYAAYYGAQRNQWGWDKGTMSWMLCDNSGEAKSYVTWPYNEPAVLDWVSASPVVVLDVRKPGVVTGKHYRPEQELTISFSAIIAALTCISEIVGMVQKLNAMRM
jgi:hypothetical protein